MSETTRRRGRPPKNPRRTRMALIEAATREFEAVGYFSTDTNKIAREAGVAPATFYRHFADKKAIFFEVYRRWVDGDWRQLEANADASVPAGARAKAMVAAHLAQHERWRQLRRSMQALRAIDDDANAIYHEVRSIQLDRMAHFRTALGVPALPREKLLFRFLTIEQALNAVTDDNFTLLDVNRERFVEQVEDEIARQIS